MQIDTGVLMARYFARYKDSTPSVRTMVERQLHNMQESYDSLLQTALQIEARLADSLVKFQQYEDTLESIWNGLDTFEQALLNTETDAPTNLQQAQQQLEIARVTISVNSVIGLSVSSCGCNEGGGVQKVVAYP